MACYVIYYKNLREIMTESLVDFEEWVPHVTCHVGVSSCGQCHRNVFTFLTAIITADSENLVSTVFFCVAPSAI